jgi:hypothetical protein
MNQLLPPTVFPQGQSYLNYRYFFETLLCFWPNDNSKVNVLTWSNRII